MDIPDDLSTKVLRWAQTMPGVQGAARLLVMSPWLADRAFVETCIVLVDNDGRKPLAIVDWAAVDHFLADKPEGDEDAVGALRAALTLARKMMHGPDS